MMDESTIICSVRSDEVLENTVHEWVQHSTLCRDKDGVPYLEMLPTGNLKPELTIVMIEGVGVYTEVS